jgi:5'(3')-deoxyribonucleotidase
MDGVLADYEGAANYKDNPEKETNGFFTNLEPINGAVEAFKKLSEHFDCYILTTAPWSSPIAMAEKRLWVEKHLGELAFKRLMTSHRKDLHIGEYLIDDRTVNGAGEFAGMHIHFGSEDFPDWDSVVEYLMNPINKEKELEQRITSLLLMNHSHHEDDNEGLIDTAKEIMREIKSHYEFE